jgi:hypothetical protein
VQQDSFTFWTILKMKKCMFVCPATYRVEEGDADVLDHAVEGHALEDTEGGDECRSALPVGERGTN